MIVCGNRCLLGSWPRLNGHEQSRCRGVCKSRYVCQQTLVASGILRLNAHSCLFWDTVRFLPASVVGRLYGHLRNAIYPAHGVKKQFIFTVSKVFLNYKLYTMYITIQLLSEKLLNLITKLVLWHFLEVEMTAFSVLLK